jgi:hypothetical protein
MPEWLVVNDFTPGIAQVISPNLPPGQATEANTFRCRSGPGGMLTAMPRRINSYDYPRPEGASSIQSEEYRIGNILCNDPVFTSQSDPAGPTIYGTDQNNSEIYLALSWYRGDLYKSRVARYLRHRTTPSWQTVYQAPNLAAPWSDNQWTRPEKCWFMTGRTNNVDPTVGGGVAVAWVYKGQARYFPDEDSPTTLTTRALPGEGVNFVFPAALIGHQGRAVILPLTVLADGPGVVYVNTEQYYYSEVNDFRNLDAALSSYFQISAGLENPVGYGALASLTSDQLLFIKARGGAMFFQGDLNDFTAVTLPNVRSTGQPHDSGVVVPSAFLYPVDASGVYAWRGGDSSIHLTDHLNPNFFRPPAVDSQGDETPWGHSWTQSASFGELVCFGNNWVYDLDRSDDPGTGWWRLDDPDDVVFHKLTVDWRGRHMYAAPSGFLSPDDPAFYEYDSTLKAASWSWQSQPHPSTLDPSRDMAVGEVLITAVGRGPVRVTVTSRANPNGRTHSVELDDPARPHTIRLPKFHIHGTHFQVRVESEASSSTGEAPDVFQYQLEVDEAHRVARS